MPPSTASPWVDGFGRLAARSAQVLLVVAAVAVAVLVLVQLRLIVVPLFIAVLVASAVSPLVRRLTARRVPRAVAAWIALLTGLGAIGLAITFVVNAIRAEYEELAMRAGEGVDELERYLTEGPLGLDQAQLEQARTAIAEAVQGEQVRTGALTGAVAAFEAVAGGFLTIVVLYFLLKDGEKIWQFLLRPLDGARRARAERIGDRAVDVLGGYVRGTATIALVDAVAIGVALAILGVPLALPLAVVVFLGAFIPLLGATVAGALAALVALVANGPVVALIVLGVVIAVNQLEGDVLAPIVLGRALALHPLAILLALTAGTIVAGVVGALLSVPLVAVAWTAVVSWREVAPPPSPAPTPPTAPAAPAAG
jgi:predicted PurR-regulated permease PerM